ncbi:MAG: hypothetical protein JSV92_01050 [archaeon]|nr:MAG: hypothetical protein JSV92_01050 [archaeon]
MVKMKKKESIRGSIQINMLTYLAIAVIVLVVIVVFIAITLRPGQETLRCQADWQAQCNKFITAGGCMKDSTLEPINDDYINETVAECAVGTIVDGEVKKACCKE